MPTSQIVPFAIAPGANVQDLATYSAAAATASGFAAGVANSAALNRAWRQSSFVAAAIAGWLVTTGADVLDDGNLAALVAKIDAALKTVGVGGTAQTIQNVTGSRAIGATYTNTTGRPIVVNMSCLSSSTNQTVTLRINGLDFVGSSQTGVGLSLAGVFLVPVGATYVAPAGNPPISSWTEIR